MKLSLSKVILLILLLLSSVPLFAEEPVEPKSRYDRRTQRYIDGWNRLIPRYSKVQFAGGMGLISVGLGWDYGKKRQWETDLFIGLMPRFSSDRACVTFTLKQNYIPWRIPLSSRVTFEPLTTGLYMNKISSHDFWAREPDKYGGPYYRFATNTRFSLFLGQRFTYGLGGRWPHRSVSFFYEVSSNDLYIISAVTNKVLKPKDYLVLSLGLKFQFL